MSTTHNQHACHLCHKVSGLSRSHIIPKFVYKPCLYKNDKNRFWVLSSNPESPERPEQRQIRERILCKSCEIHVGKYETYASKLFNLSIKDPYQEGKLISFPQVDYTSIRLFYLSILWRMSVSNHSFFDEVNLGKHEQILRKKLLAGEAPASDRYSFWCTVPLVEGNFHSDWILQPQRIKLAGQTAYRMILNGILVIFMVSCTRVPSSLRPLILEREGTWRLLVKPAEEIEFLKSWILATQKINS